MSETLEKFGKASADNKKAEATTVKTARQPGESVLSCFDLSSFSTTHPVFFVTYKKIPDPDNAKEVKIINETSWQAKVNPDNNTLTNLTLAPGYTDIGNEVGDCVECIPTAFWANSLIDGLNNSLDNNGKIKPDAIPNVTAAIKDKSITADKIDSTTILSYKNNDSNKTITGNVIIQSGWVYFLGNGGKQQSVQVTFPKKFKEVYAVIPVLIGYTFKTPTSPASFDQKIGAGTNIECGAFNQTGTTITASTSGIFGGANHGISWIAVGTV